MLFAYYTFQNGIEQSTELCLIPEKVDSMNPPVKIEVLEATHAAIQHVGPQEGVVVTLSPKEQAKVIKVVRPSIIYLTPHTPEWPGEKALEVKVQFVGIREYKVSYRREQNGEWLEWDPISRVK